MSKCDAFTAVLKEDAKENGYSIKGAAKAINKSRRQLIRDIQGDNKIGIMPVDTLAILAQRGVITDKTVNCWWQTARSELNFKKAKRKSRPMRRLLQKIL